RWTWSAPARASCAATSTASPPRPTSRAATARPPSSASTACPESSGSTSSARSSTREAACSVPAARPRWSWPRTSGSSSTGSGGHEQRSRATTGTVPIRGLSLFSANVLSDARSPPLRRDEEVSDEDLRRRQVRTHAGHQGRAPGRQPGAQGQGVRHDAEGRHADARGSAQLPQAADAEACLVPAHAAVPQGREMMRHQGKTMIVTGAAGAIGFATAEILAREGARVMLVDIAADRLEQCTEALRSAGHDAVGYVADCADEAAVEGYVHAAMGSFGRIDGFFNNAGIEGSLAPTHEYDIAEFDKIIRVNLRSMFLGLRFVIPHMVAAGR